jgi:hypothetical protein
MGIFDSVKADQGFDRGDLLPTRASEGAPPDARYLFHIDEAEVAVTTENSKRPGIPYVKVVAVVDEPADFAGYHIFPMFYLHPTPEDIKQQKGNERTLGALKALLGDDAYGAIIANNSFEAVVQGFADTLAERKPRFVGRVGIEKGVKRVGGKEVDTGYPDKNRIQYFYPATEWEPETALPGEADSDLPF